MNKPSLFSIHSFFQLQPTFSCCRAEQKRDEEREKEEQRAREAKEQAQSDLAGVTQTDGPQAAPTARYR